MLAAFGILRRYEQFAETRRTVAKREGGGRKKKGEILWMLNYGFLGKLTCCKDIKY